MMIEIKAAFMYTIVHTNNTHSGIYIYIMRSLDIDERLRDGLLNSSLVVIRGASATYNNNNNNNETIIKSCFFFLIHFFHFISFQTTQGTMTSSYKRTAIV